MSGTLIVIELRVPFIVDLDKWHDNPAPNRSPPDESDYRTGCPRMTSAKRKHGEMLDRFGVDVAKSMLSQQHHRVRGEASEEPTVGRAVRGGDGMMSDGGSFRVYPDAVGFLEFGMVVSLIANDRSGVIASEGFTACEVHLERTLSTAIVDDVTQESHLVECHFKDCLFEIVPKMSYDATLAYEKATAQLHKNDPAPVHGFSNPLSEMRFKSESEKRLNAAAYTKSHGKHVDYGQVLAIGLAPGLPAAHFVLLPRFKLRRKGEPVQIQDQIVLATDDMRLFVQPSSRFNSARAPLVTASVAHSMPWRVLVYDSSDRVRSSAEKYHQDDAQGFKAGQCLRLHHLETGSWLAYDATSATLRLDRDCDASDHATVVVGADRSRSVANARVHEGGAIHWTKHVCLRHVTSGKYLALADTDADQPAMAMAQRAPDTFAFRPLTHVNLRYASLSSSVGVCGRCRKGGWRAAFLHAASPPVPLTEDASVSCPVEGVKVPNDEDAFKLESVPQTEVHDVMLLASYRRMLQQFVMFFDAKAPCPVMMSTEAFFPDVLAALEALKAFGFYDTAADARRHVLLRKHHYMELVTRMLEAPFEPWGGPFSMAYVSLFRADARPTYDPMQSNISMTLDGLDDGSTDESAVAQPPSSGPFAALSEASLKTIHQIVRAANVLLFRMFSTCEPRDASTCGRSLSVLMKMLGHGFKASFPLSYLIQQKFHLSREFQSFSKIIRDFLDLIKAHGKSYRYVQFLVVLCTANGLAVPKIQDKICDLIFVPSEGYRDAILLETRPSH
ncbi:hypothetical protein DYB32_009759, partial [Aphanomyces invadans]